MPDIYDELLAPEGMVSARAILVGKYPWFFHTARLRNFSSIQASGLEPRRPDGYIGDPPHQVVHRIRHRADHILCLWPVGATDVHITSDEPLFQVALDSSALPVRLGLDWSFPYNWNLATIVKNDFPHWETAQVFANVAHRSGSVATYDAVPAANLLVRPNGAEGWDPTGWPNLRDVAIADIEVIPPTVP
jgi:hypothetical protein